MQSCTHPYIYAALLSSSLGLAFGWMGLLLNAACVYFASLSFFHMTGVQVWGAAWVLFGALGVGFLSLAFALSVRIYAAATEPATAMLRAMAEVE
jgi:hypothetical protein